MTVARTPGVMRGRTGVSRRPFAHVAVLVALAASVACSRGFQLRKYPQLDALFTASVAEFKAKRWDNAVAGFEKLTLDLSARDTLLPMSHWYLAQSHEEKGEHILAATSFSRLAESFPDDSLADDALFQAGSSYLRLWRNAELDPQYGTLAQAQFRTLLSVYPESPLRKEAEGGLSRIDEQFAEKDYLNGLFYVRRGGFDSAIIYFKSVVRNFPATLKSRDAMLRMVEVYKKPEMNYKDEAAEMCTALHGAYPGDKDVAKLCPPGSGADSSAVAGKSGKPVIKPPKPTVQAPDTVAGAPGSSQR